MPDPKRVARASIAILRRLGIAKYQAAATVFQICVTVANRMEDAGVANTDWIDLVGTYAWESASPHRQQAAQGERDT